MGKIQRRRERNERAAPCGPRPPATLPADHLYTRREGRGARGEGRRERDSLSKRELKCSPANPSQQSRMSDIRVELIRDLGPSRRRGEGALDTEPSPGEAERERWRRPAPRPGHLRPATGSARRRGQSPARHRTAQERAAKARAGGREGTAVDRRWHRAGWARTLRYEVPQHARCRRRCRHTPRRHTCPAPRLPPPAPRCREGVCCQGTGCTPCHPLSPPGPRRTSPGPGGVGGEGLTVLLRGAGWKPTSLCVLPAARDHEQGPGQETPLCIPAICSLTGQGCIYRHHSPLLGEVTPWFCH